MAKLTKAEVVHVAKLANLTLTDAEIEKFLKQLTGIVDFVSELSKVDTSNVEPTSQTTGLVNVTRADTSDSTNCLTVDLALSGTDQTHNNLFMVDAILKGKTDK